MEKAENGAPAKCGVVYALGIIGGKWRLPIIWRLSAQDGMRYNELRRRLDGITNIMLTRALKELEAYGLVRREEKSRIPPHVEYFLTESCRQLLPALRIINAWGEENQKACGENAADERARKEQEGELK